MQAFAIFSPKFSPQSDLKLQKKSVKKFSRSRRDTTFEILDKVEKMLNQLRLLFLFLRGKFRENYCFSSTSSKIATLLIMALEYCDIPYKYKEMIFKKETKNQYLNKSFIVL